jgi:putative ABC transport system substrate-binding protein
MGYAVSLARPGGNLTGLVTFYAELIPKQLELVKSLLPKASRIAMLENSKVVGAVPAFDLKIREAAQTLGIRLQTVPIDSPEQLPQAFAAMKRERADALIAVADEMFYVERRLIAELALKQRLPAIFATRENVEAGGLMSYGEDALEKFAQAAKYVSKIMKGARPGDLPIEQPTKFQLTINRKTAKALKLTIPQDLILRADRLIE